MNEWGGLFLPLQFCHKYKFKTNSGKKNKKTVQAITAAARAELFL